MIFSLLLKIGWYLYLCSHQSLAPLFLAGNALNSCTTEELVDDDDDGGEKWPKQRIPTSCNQDNLIDMTNKGRIFTSYYPGPVLVHTGQPPRSLRKEIIYLILILRCFEFHKKITNSWSTSPSLSKGVQGMILTCKSIFEFSKLAIIPVS